MKTKIKTAMILAGILLSSSVLANPVVMQAGLDATEQLSAMQQFMERARAVAPDGAGAPMLLVNTFHGTNSPGGASVAITFDSLEHWAKVTANQRTNPKWQALMQTFPVDSFKANYQGLTEIVWQSQGATPPTAGNILVIYGFNIVQGGVQPLMSFLDRLTDVGKKENIGGQPTVMVPMVTGAGNNQQATGNRQQATGNSRYQV